MGALFGAGLGGATDHVCVPEPWGQGKPPPPDCGGVCPRHDLAGHLLVPTVSN